MSYTDWSRRADSNRHLSFTRALFFPLNYFDPKFLERVTGFEPVSGPWQGPILAARRYLRGASGENRTLLACLEGRNSANKSRSLYNDLYSVVKEHTSTAAHGRLDPYSPDALLPDLSAVKTHWSGTPDSNRESHDPKSCGLSRFPSARRKAPVKSERAGLSTGPVMRIQSTYLIRGYGPSRALRVSTHAGFVPCGILPKWIACIITQLHSK